MSKAYERVFLIVLDSVGIGEAPDAAKFGDVGSHTSLLNECRLDEYQFSFSSLLVWMLVYIFLHSVIHFYEQNHNLEQRIDSFESFSRKDHKHSSDLSR